MILAGNFGQGAENDSSYSVRAALLESPYAPS
jgi:hypothetical protein